MINAFAREAIAAAEKGLSFPLTRIQQIAIEKNRTGNLHEYQLLNQPWLATKVLMPHRSYVFHGNKPQIDHIFPLNLAGTDEEYQQTVDVLWNLQPMPAEINNYKNADHPREFFQSEDGSKYWRSYDFIPNANIHSWTESDISLWNDHRAFIANRKQQMLQKLKELYGLIPATPVTI